MKRKFLKLVIAFSLSVSFGFGAVAGGFGKQALATSITQSDTDKNEVMVEDLDSASKEFYDFLMKYTDFDSSKLDERNKKIYDNIKTNLAEYVTVNELGLNADEQKAAVDLLWGLADEDTSDELFDQVLSYLGMDMSGFIKVVISAFQAEAQDVELQFYELLINSFEFDVAKLSEEQKKVFDSVKSNVDKFLDKYKLDVEEGTNLVISAIVYNLMQDSTQLSTKLLVQVVSYLGLDFSTFKELVGEFYTKFEDYFSVTAILSDYVHFVYGEVLGEEVSHDDLNEIYTNLIEKKLSARNFIYDVLDRDGLYSDKNPSVIVEKLYTVILLREIDQGGLDFWTSKLDELVKGGKSLKDAVKDVAGQMMGSDEFKGLVEGFGLEY